MNEMMKFVFQSEFTLSNRILSETQNTEEEDKFSNAMRMIQIEYKGIL